MRLRRIAAAGLDPTELGPPHSLSRVPAAAAFSNPATAAGPMARPWFVAAGYWEDMPLPTERGRAGAPRAKPAAPRGPFSVRSNRP